LINYIDMFTLKMRAEGWSYALMAMAFVVICGIPAWKNIEQARIDSVRAVTVEQAYRQYYTDENTKSLYDFIYQDVARKAADGGLEKKRDPSGLIIEKFGLRDGERLSERDFLRNFEGALVSIHAYRDALADLGLLDDRAEQNSFERVTNALELFCQEHDRIDLFRQFFGVSSESVLPYMVPQSFVKQAEEGKPAMEVAPSLSKENLWVWPDNLAGNVAYISFPVPADKTYDMLGKEFVFEFIVPPSSMNAFVGRRVKAFYRDDQGNLCDVGDDIEIIQYLPRADQTREAGAFVRINAAPDDYTPNKFNFNAREFIIRIGGNMDEPTTPDDRFIILEPRVQNRVSLADELLYDWRDIQVAAPVPVYPGDEAYIGELTTPALIGEIEENSGDVRKAIESMPPDQARSESSGDMKFNERAIEALSRRLASGDTDITAEAIESLKQRHDKLVIFLTGGAVIAAGLALFALKKRRNARKKVSEKTSEELPQPLHIDTDINQTVLSVLIRGWLMKTREAAGADAWQKVLENKEAASGLFLKKCENYAAEEGIELSDTAAEFIRQEAERIIAGEALMEIAETQLPVEGIDQTIIRILVRGWLAKTQEAAGEDTWQKVLRNAKPATDSFLKKCETYATELGVELNDTIKKSIRQEAEMIFGAEKPDDERSVEPVEPTQINANSTIGVLQEEVNIGLQNIDPSVYRFDFNAERDTHDVEVTVTTDEVTRTLVLTVFYNEERAAYEAASHGNASSGGGRNGKNASS
ncbi:MAG: hypothetical protein ABIH74_05665, partial [Candidatus Omnitrophota bacterium]